MTAPPIVIAPGQTSATLVLKAADNAPPGMSSLNIKGKARIGSSGCQSPGSLCEHDLGGPEHRRHLSPLTVDGSVMGLGHGIGAGSFQSAVVDPELRLEAPLTGTVKFPVKVSSSWQFSRGPGTVYLRVASEHDRPAARPAEIPQADHAAGRQGRGGVHDHGSGLRAAGHLFVLPERPRAR